MQFFVTRLLMFLGVASFCVAAQTLIDVEADLQDDDRFTVDCWEGYKVSPSEYTCPFLAGKGGVNVTANDVNGQAGFWTECSAYMPCRVNFEGRADDKNYTASLYQRNSMTQVSFDSGNSWFYVGGEGWITIQRELTQSNKEVRLIIPHEDENTFTILDKIVINGNL